MRSFRQKLTPAITAIVGLMCAASLLAAIQLFLLDLPLAATAALLVGGALVLLAWKVQNTSIMTQALKRRVAALGHAPQQPPTPSPDVAPVEPGATAAEAETDTEPPQVPHAPRASRQLFVAVHGDGSRPTRRAIAVVGSDELAMRLDAHGSIQRLHPLLSVAELEHARPSTLVVEEDGIDLGPWTGALDPHGAALLAELREAFTWMHRNGGLVYVLPATESRKPSAAALRADTIVLDDSALATQTPEAPQSLLTTLAAHCHTKAGL